MTKEILGSQWTSSGLQGKEVHLARGTMRCELRKAKNDWPDCNKFML